MDITHCALAWSVGRAKVYKIDQINIFRAILLALQRAVTGLAVAPDFVLVDGNRCPLLPTPSQAVVKGDSQIAKISTASIIFAKVTLDRKRVALHLQFSKYDFAKHKGYPTAFHLEKHALQGGDRSFSMKLCPDLAASGADMNLSLSRGAIVAPTPYIG